MDVYCVLCVTHFHVCRFQHLFGKLNVPTARILDRPSQFTGKEAPLPFFGMAQPQFPILYLTPNADNDPMAQLLAFCTNDGEVLVNGEAVEPNTAFLMKRRVLIERARIAQAIAVVVGTWCFGGLLFLFPF